eukprot:5189941-Amphidinium_carterae.1
MEGRSQGSFAPQIPVLRTAHAFREDNSDDEDVMHQSTTDEDPVARTGQGARAKESHILQNG